MEVEFGVRRGVLDCDPEKNVDLPEERQHVPIEDVLSNGSAPCFGLKREHMVKFCENSSCSKRHEDTSNEFVDDKIIKGKKSINVVAEFGIAQCNMSDSCKGSSSVETRNEETTSPCNGALLIGSSVPSSCQEDRALFLDAESLIDDHAVALWVKWRGKWQSGIRCPKADCPLLTLKAKPTHERKQYFVVFFPRTRSYSWADIQLVCSIDEFPEPLVSGTHRKWKKLVKDLTLPFRYIMQKLAVAMLNLSDQLHVEAVMENARKATTWKDFALEASCCRTYSGLGNMLIKLKHMILPAYLNQNWREVSFNSWVQRCVKAQSAESIEILIQELVDSVLWKEVGELWNHPLQIKLGPEWENWKLESMKLFSLAYPRAGKGSIEPPCSDICAATESQYTAKRPKLIIRRAELPVCQAEPPDFQNHHCRSIVPFMPKHENHMEPDITFEKSDAISANGDKLKIINFEENHRDQAKALNVSLRLTPDSTKRYVQCSALVAGKGRQCGRWANDGDIYCCVHLNARYAGPEYQSEPKPPEEAPMCAGTTSCGSKCKHRARYGSAFCKKHCLQESMSFINKDDSLDLAKAGFKRKFDSNKEEKVSIAVLPEGSKLQNKLAPISVENTLDERKGLMGMSELNNSTLPEGNSSTLDISRCVGSYVQNHWEQCLQNPSKHTLYCENHLPRFLKRARNGKSRPVSKDVFVGLLRSCSSRKQKLFLHQACELLFQFMKTNLSRQKLLSREESMKWILAQASLDPNVRQFLLKLVVNERDKLGRIWGFHGNENKHIPSSSTLAVPDIGRVEPNIRCKMCSKEFVDDKKLGLHWTQNHKKEAKWMFREYSCSLCLNSSFNNKKVLQAHVKESHGVQFLRHSTLFRCVSCGNTFVSQSKLSDHVLAFHITDLRLQDSSNQNSHILHLNGGAVNGNLSNSTFNLEKYDTWSEEGSKAYICRFCGLKFNHLPDLDRHHQAAHLKQIATKSGNNHLRPSGHSMPRFKRSLGMQFQPPNPQVLSSTISERSLLQSQAIQSSSSLQMLDEPQCSGVAAVLFSEIQKTKPRPNNTEILSVARTTCCRTKLHSALEVKYGFLPENLYLRAAKLCSELNIPIEWHREGFICPKGCKSFRQPSTLAPLKLVFELFIEPSTDEQAGSANNPSGWEMDECHYVLRSNDLNKSVRKSILLCEDVSFGREPVPVPCVVDPEFKDSLRLTSDGISSQAMGSYMPWLAFTYVTKRLIDPPQYLDTKNSQLGCGCSDLKCRPESCDHVYLFENDYEDAADIYDQPMHGRFPYNERGQIILKEGYMVYECNAMCRCDRTCQNRVLQNGVQVKLEIFKTKKKGWAVRAGEDIPRGTFVCECIGEVVSNAEAKKRGERFDRNGCNYLYDIDAHIDNTRGLSEGAVPYVIDATVYGNVSRFVNHSCSPNLVNYMVLVESMDCQLAHIGLYASRDISIGEELTHDYRYRLLPGEGTPCHCESPDCRGRLH